MEQHEGSSDVEPEYTAADIAVHEVVESFYLETMEGLFFAVKGLEHPPDRWIAVLRYAPDPERGSREKRSELPPFVPFFGTGRMDPEKLSPVPSV